MSATTLAGIIVAAVAVVGIIVWSVARRRHTDQLQQQYGTEYDRTVARAASRQVAEAELVKRQERVEQFDIRPLSADQREMYGQQWHDLQELFVDNPGRAVARADGLVAEVMRERGYPVADFEQRASDLSVHHAVFVQNYRAARDVAARHRQGAATTEELRRAMVYYRDLFEDLLRDTDPTSDRQVTRVVEREVPMTRDGTSAGARIDPQPIAPPRSDREVR